MVTIIQERSSGERIMQDAHRVFPLGSGREPEWLGRPEHELRFAPGTRTVTGATLSYFGPHGRKTAEVEVETLLAFPLLLGTRLRPRARLEARDVPGRPGGPGPAGRHRPTRPTRTGGSPSTRPGSPARARSATACSSAPSWAPTSSTASPAEPGGRTRRAAVDRGLVGPSHPVRAAHHAHSAAPASTNSASGSRVQGTLCSHRGRRSSQKPPVVSTAAGAAASQTTVSAPWSGVRRNGPITRANPGRLSAGPPGCRPSPGAWRGTRRPAPVRAADPLVHEHELGPLGPGVGDGAVVVVRPHFERVRGRTSGCTSRPTTPGSPGTGRRRADREQEAGQQVRGRHLRRPP